MGSNSGILAPSFCNTSLLTAFDFSAGAYFPPSSIHFRNFLHHQDTLRVFKLRCQVRAHIFGPAVSVVPDTTSSSPSRLQLHWELMEPIEQLTKSYSFFLSPQRLLCFDSSTVIARVSRISSPEDQLPRTHDWQPPTMICTIRQSSSLCIQ